MADFDFLKDIGDMLTEKADDLGRKAEKTFEVQKTKSQIRSLKRLNEKDYADLGRMVFEKFVNGEVEDVAYINLCTEIEKRKEEIVEKENQIAETAETTEAGEE